MGWWGHRPSPPGDARGFDLVTGRLLWTFHTVAQGGEPGVETWEQDSWKEAGNANVWAPMSADEELGYAYLPVSTPTNDYYGGDRPGDGLGPLFTPPSERGIIQVPGVAGGANWSGGTIDPETATLYVGTYRLPFVVSVRKPGASESSYDFIGEFRYLPGPRGLPLLKPPFGSIVAIDMNTGEHRWRIPVGRGELIPTIRQLGVSERLGFPGRNWVLVTKTVMVVVQMGYYGSPRLPPGGTRRIADLNNFDPHLWVYDKGSGEMLAEITLPANATGAPITYMAGGKQYIAFPVGGGPLVEELIAVAL